MHPPHDAAPAGVVTRDRTVSTDAMRWHPHDSEPYSPDGADAVSDAPAITRIEQARQFTQLLAEHARMPLHAPERPTLTVRVFEHKAALFTRIATEQPTDEHHELARTARRQLAEARHRYADTATSEPTTPISELEEAADV